MKTINNQSDNQSSVHKPKKSLADPNSKKKNRSKKKASKTIFRASKYTIIGILLTLLNFAIYTTLARTVFGNTNELLWLDTIISYLVATVAAYFLHSKITWRERHPGKKGIFIFFAWNIITSVAISPFLTWLFGFIKPLYEFAFTISSNLHLPFDYEFIESTGIFCFTTLITMILNYLCYDKIVFGAPKEKNASTSNSAKHHTDSIKKMQKKNIKTLRLKSIFTLDNFLKFILSLIFSLSLSWNAYGDFSVVNFTITFIITLLLMILLWPKFKKITLSKNPPNKIQKWEFIVFAILTILVLVIAIIARYPGGVSFDVNAQYQQALTGEYNNWHPVLHTLFTFKIPQLFYKGYFGTIIFQTSIIFAIIMYFCYFCRKNFLNFLPTLFVLLLIILNPTFLDYSIIPWKDILYSWAIVLSTLYLILIITTNGKWLTSKSHKVLFIIATLGILCFRHNGIVPFALIYSTLAIALTDFRKFLSITGVSLLVIYFIITGPIFKALNFGESGGITEAMGTMMGQISQYYHNRTNEFSDEELQTLNNIEDLEVWREKYDPTNFNPIKMTHASEYNAKLEDNLTDVLAIWWTKSISNPKSFVDSYFNITSPIWQSGREITMPLDNYDQEKLGYDKGRWKELSNNVERYVESYQQFVNNSALRFVFFDVGGGLMLILLAFALVIVKTRKRIRYLIPFIPLLANTFIMMIMITGQEVRFVYSQIICALPLLIYAFSLPHIPDRVHRQNNQQSHKR